MRSLVFVWGSLPAFVWIESAVSVGGIVLGIMAILRRPLRWVGSAMLIATVAILAYWTNRLPAMAALVVWAPAFIALLIGFLLVARGYHKKAWYNIPDAGRPLADSPKRHTLSHMVRERIRRNFADDAVAGSPPPKDVNSIVPPPPEPKEVVQTPMIAMTEVAVPPGVRYHAAIDSLDVSFGRPRGAYTQEAQDLNGQIIPGILTVHDIRDDSVVGVEIHQVSQLWPSVFSNSKAVESQIRGLWPQDHGAASERTVYHHIIGLAADLMTNELADPFDGTRYLDRLVKLGQDVVDYVQMVDPTRLSDVPKIAISGTEGTADGESESTAAIDPTPNGTDIGLNTGDRPNRTLESSSINTPPESSITRAAHDLSDLPASSAEPVPQTLGAAKGTESAAVVASNVETIVQQAVGRFGHALEHALGAFGEDLATGLSTATKNHG